MFLIISIIISKKNLLFFREDRYKVLGLDLKELENFESLLTHLSILTEELLLESSEAKINLRNLLVWLNKSIFLKIKTQ